MDRQALRLFSDSTILRAIVKKIFTNPATLPSWPDFFTNIVTVKGNGIETIYISGQIGLDRNKNVLLICGLQFSYLSSMVFVSWCFP